MSKVQIAIMVALECGVMTLQELFDKTPYHIIAVTREVESLVSQGRVKSSTINMNDDKSQLLEISHGN